MGLFENRQQTLSLLHTFSVAAKYLSFTQAADELCLTQGAVSHRIKKWLFDVSSGFQYFSGRARYHVDHGDESGCISIASSPPPRGLK